MIKEIILKDRRIEYELQIKAVKNINLRIKADRTVFVSASPSVSEKTLEEFLVSKSDYILNALEYYEDIAKYAPKPKQYVDGESFRIFGHDRRLIVVKGTNNAVESDESYITLTVKTFLTSNKSVKLWNNGDIIYAKIKYSRFVKLYIRNFRNTE